MTQKSLKTMTESKTVEGIQKTTQFKVDPRLIIIEEGFNARPIDPDHVESIRIAYSNGAYLPPLVVRVEEGRIYLVDGHHRLQAILQLPEVMRVDVTEFKGNTADRVALMLTTASGKPLTPLEAGYQYRKLINYGWSMGEIALKVGKTQAHISQGLKLTELSPELQQSVREGKITATLAAKNPQLGKLEGKVTAASLGQYPLHTAIQMEIDGKGKAEELCTKHAKLISYLRGSGIELKQDASAYITIANETAQSENTNEN